MAITKIAALVSNNAGGNTFTVPAGVTSSHLGFIMLGASSSGIVWSIPSCISRVSNPAGVGNQSWQVFSRLGGLTAGDTFTVTVTAGSTTVASHITAVWFDTQGRDVNIVGTPGTRNAVSSSFETIPAITTPVATDIILALQERTTATGTVITQWQPFTPTEDSYQESNTTLYPSNNTDTAQYFGHFAQSHEGHTGNFKATHTSGSLNGAGVLMSLAAPASPPATNVRVLHKEIFDTSMTDRKVTLTATPVAGRRLLLSFLASNSTASAVTDTRGNNWIKDRTVSAGTPFTALDIWSCQPVNPLVAGDSITVTNGGGTYGYVYVIEPKMFLGPKDGQGGQSGSTQPINGAGSAPDTNNSFLFGAVYHNTNAPETITPTGIWDAIDQGMWITTRHLWVLDAQTTSQATVPLTVTLPNSGLQWAAETNSYPVLASAPVMTGWRYWDGVEDKPITFEGMYDGTTVDPGSVTRTPGKTWATFDSGTEGWTATATGGVGVTLATLSHDTTIRRGNSGGSLKIVSPRELTGNTQSHVYSAKPPGPRNISSYGPIFSCWLYMEPTDVIGDHYMRFAITQSANQPLNMGMSVKAIVPGWNFITQDMTGLNDLTQVWQVGIWTETWNGTTTGSVTVYIDDYWQTPA